MSMHTLSLSRGLFGERKLLGLTGIFLVSLFVMTAYLPYLSVQSLAGTPLESALSNSEYVMYGIICTISVTGTIALELILDIFLEHGLTKLKDQGERLFLLTIVIIPGIFILKNAHKSDIPYLFCCLHSVQVIGSAAPIYSLCCKLVPAHFTYDKIFLSYLFWASAGSFMFIGFKQPLNSYANVSVFLSVFLSLGLMVNMISSWGKDLLARIPAARSTYKTQQLQQVIARMNEDECCCAVYLGCSFVTIVMVPAITGVVRLYKWEQWHLFDLCVNIYALAAFSVFSGVVPGRFRQHSAQLQIEQKVKTIRHTIRYISHEIRSPLNIIHNGIQLLRSNLHGQYQPDTLDDLTDIENASCAAMTIADDLLCFENMEGGSFHIEKNFEPAGRSLTELANRCKVLATVKGVHFDFQNLLDSPDNGDSYLIFVDLLKIEQVLRNLIGNAVKFTPPEGCVGVKLRYEPLLLQTKISTHCALTKARSKFLEVVQRIKRCFHCIRTTRVHAGSPISSLPRSSPAHAPASIDIQHNVVGTLCLDISDTGVGLTQVQAKQVFEKFSQFNANQLLGGGGSGLGLWLSNEIIKLHGGSISLKSDGPGCGTTFTVRLNCYWKVEERYSPHVPTPGNYSVGRNELWPDISIAASSLRYNLSCRCSESLAFKGADVSNCSSEMKYMVSPVNSTFKSLGTGTDEEKRACSADASNVLCPTSLQILVVDDSSLNRKLLLKVLNNISNKLNENQQTVQQLELFEADDGTSALEIMDKSDEFQLVLIDNIMTRMNGPQAVQQMRQKGFKGLIIGVTGNVTESDISDFIKSGANQVLKKPVPIENLQNIILNLFLREQKQALGDLEAASL